MKKGIKIGKYTLAPRFVIAVAAILILVIVLCAAVSAVRASKARKAAEQLGCTFDTDGFAEVANVEYLGGDINVFTDKQGKMGIMKPDGTVTEEARQDKIYTVSDAWRSVKYVCEGPLSEYRLLIDPETATVTSRQYHGVTEPEKTAYWSSTGNHLAWYDELGYAGEVVKNEVSLENGLYPVQTAPEDGKKFGFINENLSLEIALLYDGALDFSEGLAPVMRNGKWGYINENGVTAVDFRYEPAGESGAFPFADGLAPVKKNGMCGIINRKGKAVVAFEFDMILPGSGGKFIAKKGSAWGLITVNKDILDAETTAATTTTKPENLVVQGNYKVVTAGSSLNLRATADTSSAVLARIPNGTVITVTKSVDGWAYTTYNSASGWVSADYIREIPTETSAVPESSDSAVSGTAQG
ncbi:MAG: WG repeat-containing protein [Clostridia bacterium]|nr:WG repeat-containing protein [Clostridia bacterium]